MRKGGSSVTDQQSDLGAFVSQNDLLSDRGISKGNNKNPPPMEKFSRNVLVSGELLIQDTNLKPIKEEAFDDFEDSQRQSFLSRNPPIKKFSKKSIVGLLKLANEVVEP
jgi:hypothetical protein